MIFEYFEKLGAKAQGIFLEALLFNLINVVKDMAGKTTEERVSLAKNVKHYTWKESAAWLLGVLKYDESIICESCD